MSDAKILHQQEGVTIFEMDVRNYKGKAYGEVLVSVGPSDILYSKLQVPKSPTEEDKYAVMLQINESQREFLLDKLAPLAVELAKLKGLTLASPSKKPLSEKEAEQRELAAAKLILEGKLKRLEEPDAYKLGANHRMAFFNTNEEGEMEASIQRIAIQGPDGKPLSKLMLTNGSIGIINFILKCNLNPATGKPAFPFQLEAVKVTEPVFYESQAPRGRHDSFEHVESDYELPSEDDE